MENAGKTLAHARAKIAALDVGGGFASPYPGLELRPLSDYFAAIARMKDALGLPADVPLLCEPGRALVRRGYVARRPSHPAQERPPAHQ